MFSRNSSCIQIYQKCCIFICGSKRVKQEYAREQVQEDNLALHRVSTVVSDYTYRSQEPRYSVSSPRRSMNTNRRSIQSSHHRPTVALPNSLLNPILKKENAQNPSSIRANFKNRCWKDVNIGDIIRIRANEEVPADVIIISTSDLEGTVTLKPRI